MPVVPLVPVTNYSDALSIFQMPFLINSYELEAEVLQSDAWKNLVAAANEDLGTATIVGAQRVRYTALCHHQ